MDSSGALPDFYQLLKQTFADVTPLSPEMITRRDAESEPSVYEGKQWYDISPVALNPSEAGSLTEHVLLYYLPAYLNAVMSRDWFDKDLDLDPLLHSLYTPDTPGDSWLPKDRWHEKFKRWDHLMHLLTSKQKHVIRIWLDLVKEKYPKKRDQINLMLSNYWDQY